MRRSSTLRTVSPFAVATLLPHPRVEGVAQAVTNEPDDKDVEDVREEMLRNKAEGAGPKGPRGQEELLLLEPEHLAPDQAGRARPASQPYGDGQREDPRTQDEHSKDGHNEDGDTDQDLDDALHYVVDPAAVITRDGTVGHADAQVHNGDKGGDVQRDPGAEPDPVEHAAPKLVGSEPVPGERRCFVLLREVLPHGCVWREPGAGDGQGEDEDDEAAGGDRDAVPLQPPPGVTPEAHRGTSDLLRIFGAPLYGLE